MSPFGKIAIALISWIFWDLNGLLWGLFLGHILIDRSILNKWLKRKIHQTDDALRIIIPYQSYKILDTIEAPFQNSVYKKAKRGFDILFDRNLIKILGAIIGITTQSNTLIFTGIIIGYFIDSYALDRGLKNKTFIRFWRKINPLKLALNSSEARNRAFVSAMAFISAKICKADGEISEKEITIFKKLFSINEDDNSEIHELFYSASKKRESYDRYAYQLKLIADDNIELKENIIENLFKIATIDEEAGNKKLDILKKIAKIIDLPKGNFNIIKNNFAFDDNKDCYQILGVNSADSNEDIKRKWKKIISENHPDKIQAAGGTAEEIDKAALKLAKINNAYQNIIKTRNIKE